MFPEEPELEVPEVVAARTAARLPILPPSPWRSLGKIFDYREWAARDRFLELDQYIAALPRTENADSTRSASSEMEAVLQIVAESSTTMQAGSNQIN